MTDLNKGKVASLTGSLLARKGRATPAGFVRVSPGEDEAPDQPVSSTSPQAGDESVRSSEQPSLAFGADFEKGPGAGSEEGADEGWAPLSQIVIRPHPYMSKGAATREPAPVSPSAAEIGIEPTLLAEGDLKLSVGAEPLLDDDGVAVETPRVAPSAQRNEPILVVPRLSKGAPDKGDINGELDEAHKAGYEELAAPTLTPVEDESATPAALLGETAGDGDGVEDTHRSRDIGPTPLAAIISDGDGIAGASAGRVASEPQSRAEDLAPRFARTPSVDAPPPRRVAPAAVRQGEAKSEATPIIVPPIRIGELAAQARVIPARKRRRRRLAPLVLAVLALAVFLGVTWQAYRTNQDSEGGFAAPLGADGEPTIWATVDELGYAVSQVIGALTGRSPSEETGDTLLAERPEEFVPTPTFSPIGPVSGGAEPAETAGSVVALDVGPGGATQELVGESAPAEGAEASDTVAVPEALPAPVSEVESSPLVEPLPTPPLVAPPVPEPPTIAAVTTPPPTRPVGVTAPPAPPLDSDSIVSARVLETSTPAPGLETSTPEADPAVSTSESVGLEEVNTTVALELSEPAAVTVSAGPSEVPGGEPTAAEDTAVAAGEPQEAEIAALPAPEAAALGIEAVGDLSEAGIGSAADIGPSGVPVLKPSTRASQQPLQTAALAAASARVPDGVGDETGDATDGYAVQLSSLKTKAQAEREFERLKTDYPALLRDIELVVREGSVSNRGTFFRVLTSRFEDAGDARLLCQGLRERGQDCLVVRR